MRTVFMKLVRITIVLSTLALVQFLPWGPVQEVKAQSPAFSSVYIDPVSTPGPVFNPATSSNFTVSVRLNLTAGEIINGFDVRLNYTLPGITFPDSVVRVSRPGAASLNYTGSLSYTGNIFAGKQGASVLLECIDGIIIMGQNCPNELFGQIHFTESLLGDVIQGPIVGGLLFRARFFIKGNGRTIFTVDTANLLNPGPDPSNPNPRFVQVIKMAGVFGNAGVVAFFNFEPVSSPSVIAGQDVIFDGRGSFNATVPTTRIVRYDWAFGDGTLLQSQPAIVHHPFGLPGRFNVRLNVTDAVGDKGFIVRPVLVAPALGGLDLTVKDQQGTPHGGVRVEIFNSTFASTPFLNRTSDLAGDVLLKGLKPQPYLVKFSGPNVETDSRMESVIAGWTTQDTVYLKFHFPTPPPYYGDIIFLGSIAGGLGAVSVAILMKRRNSPRGARLRKPPGGKIKGSQAR